MAGALHPHTVDPHIVVAHADAFEVLESLLRRRKSLYIRRSKVYGRRSPVHGRSNGVYGRRSPIYGRRKHNYFESPKGKIIYLDPPYWLSNQASSLYGTKGDMHKGFDHDRLAKLCESLNKKGWKILISYNNDQKVIDSFPNFGVDEVDWTYGMKNVSDETMGESSEILLYSEAFSYQQQKTETKQTELLPDGAKFQNRQTENQ